MNAPNTKSFASEYWDHSLDIPICLRGAICIAKASGFEEAGKANRAVNENLINVLRVLCDGHSDAVYKDEEGIVSKWHISDDHIEKLLTEDAIKKRIVHLKELCDGGNSQDGTKKFHEEVFPDKRGLLVIDGTGIGVVNRNRVNYVPGTTFEAVDVLGNHWIASCISAAGRKKDGE